MASRRRYSASPRRHQGTPPVSRPRRRSALAAAGPSETRPGGAATPGAGSTRRPSFPCPPPRPVPAVGWFRSNRLSSARPQRTNCAGGSMGNRKTTGIRARHTRRTGAGCRRDLMRLPGFSRANFFASRLRSWSWTSGRSYSAADRSPYPMADRVRAASLIRSRITLRKVAGKIRRAEDCVCALRSPRHALASRDPQRASVCLTNVAGTSDVGGWSQTLDKPKKAARHLLSSACQMLPVAISPSRGPWCGSTWLRSGKLRPSVASGFSRKPHRRPSCRASGAACPVVPEGDSLIGLHGLIR